MTNTVKLVFNNAETTPKSCIIECTEESVHSVMAWYGAYHAGNRYTVTKDARNVRMDLNGEPVDD